MTLFNNIRDCLATTDHKGCYALSIIYLIVRDVFLCFRIVCTQQNACSHIYISGV